MEVDNHMENFRQEIEELVKEPHEVMQLLGRRVRAFRDTLASYLIPETGIERYTQMLMLKRQSIINSYTSGRISELGGITNNALAIYGEIVLLDSAAPGKLSLEQLTPLQTGYLRDMFRTEVELYQMANDEYLKR